MLSDNDIAIKTQKEQNSNNQKTAEKGTISTEGKHRKKIGKEQWVSKYYKQMHRYVLLKVGCPVIITAFIFCFIIFLSVYTTFDSSIKRVRDLNQKFSIDRLTMANDICAKYIQQQVTLDIVTWSYYTRLFLGNTFDRTPAEIVPAAQFQCEYMKDHLKKTATIFDASSGVANLPSCGSAADCLASGTTQHDAAITAINAQSPGIYDTIMAGYRYPPCFWAYGQWEAKHYLEYQADLATDADMLSDYLYILNSTSIISNIYSKDMASNAAPSTTVQLAGSIIAYNSFFIMSTTKITSTNTDYRNKLKLWIAYNDEPIYFYPDSALLDLIGTQFEGCDTIGYDPRCRPFYKVVETHVTDYKANNGNLNNFVADNPTIVSDVFIDWTGELFFTVMVPEQNSANTALKRVIGIDLIATQIKSTLKYAYGLIKPDDPKASSTDYGYFLLKKDTEGKYRKVLMTSFKENEDAIMTENQDNYPDIKQWVNWQNGQGTKFNVNTTYHFDQTVEGKKVEVSILTKELVTKYFTLTETNYVGYLVLGVSVRSEFFYDQIATTDKNAGVTQIIYVVLVLILCIAIIIIAYIASLKLGAFLADSFDLLLWEIIKIELNNEVKRSDKFKSRPYEVVQLYNCYLSTRHIITNAENSKKTELDSQTYLDLKLAFKLFQYVKNDKSASILLNNMGNINYKQGYYDESIKNYERSIAMYENSEQIQKESKMHESKIKLVKIKRRLNLINAIEAKYKELKAKDSNNKENDILVLTDRLEKVTNDLNKNAKSINRSDLELFCQVIQAFINSEIKRKNITKGKDLIKGAKQIYTNFIEKNSNVSPNYKACLQQRYMVGEARILYIKNKIPEAVEQLSNALQKGERFNLRVRSDIIDLLKQIFETEHEELTPGLLELEDRLNRRFKPKEYVVALDYSRSMAFSNRIESAIGLILKLWDDYLMDSDKIGFLKYNLNVEITFNVEKKTENEFSKRVAIEKSNSPNERTCLYDAIIAGYKMQTSSKSDPNARKYFILISDGADTASIKTFEQALKVIEGNYHEEPNFFGSKAQKVTMIGIGMGLTQEEAEILESLCVKSNYGHYMEFDKEKVIKILEEISGYAASNQDFDLFQESI